MSSTPSPPRRRRRAWIWLFLGLTLVQGLLSAVLIPPWQGPDETGHFEYVWLLTHLGRVPKADDLSPAFERELIASLYEWRYGEYTQRPLPERMPERLSELPANSFARNARTVIKGRFSLSYLWTALFVGGARHQDLVTQLYLGRLSSVVLAVLTCWLACRAAEAVWHGHRASMLLTMTIYTLIPQRAFINSMVGDGPLAELMATLVFYCWVCLVRRGFSMRYLLGIILGTLLGISSKSTAVFLIPLDAALGLWWLVKARAWTLKRNRLALALAALALIGGLALWTRLPLGEMPLRTVSRVLPGTEQRGLLIVDDRGNTLAEAGLATFESFWASFGWMAAPIGERWYGALLVLTATGLGGWLLERHDADRETMLPAVAACLMAGAVFTWAALLSQPGYFQTQGRYLFPVALPAILLWVGGLRRMSGPRLLAGAAVGGFMVILNVWSWARYAISFFYG